jgi:DNA-binding NarL/FixJ family response regulator
MSREVADLARVGDQRALGSGAARQTIRVLVVDANFYTRLGAVAFLETQPEIEVVGQAATGQVALALFARLRPDVTLIELSLPGMDGLRLIVSLRQRAPEARLLVLTHRDGDEDIYQALKAGARGYLTKESSGDQLLAAIRALHTGDLYLPPDVAAAVASRRGLPELTRRERQVLAQIADGASNREIARALGISEHTVALHVGSILRKLGACSRTEAVSIAIRRGILH